MKTRFAASLLMILLCTGPAWAEHHEGDKSAGADKMAGDKMAPFDPDKAKWVTPDGLPECAKMTVIKGDPNTGPATLLVKAGPMCTIPWHWHTATETVMMTGGTGKMEMKDGDPVKWQAGGYAALPGKHVHRVKCVLNCMAFIQTSGKFDIHYVNENGDEITTDEALGKKKAEKPSENSGAKSEGQSEEKSEKKSD